MPRIKDLLINRRVEVTQRMEVLRAEMSELQAELRQIVAAESAIDQKQRPLDKRRREHTIKDLVIKILDTESAGLDANAIRDRLASRFNRRVKRESLSPQLSRLKDDGVIEYENKLWRLPGVTGALERMAMNVRAKNSPAEAGLNSENGHDGESTAAKSDSRGFYQKPLDASETECKFALK